MADTTPFGNNGLSVNLLPGFYQTPANKKFLQATIDQLYQPGTVTKTSGYIGRENAKAATGADVYVNAASQTRQNYQLEPGLVIKDSLGNVTFFKDYIDYINQLNVFGGNTSNHARLNKQEMYSWDPHIDWDKLVNFQNYYWLPYGPDPITIFGQQHSVTSTYTVNLETVGNDNLYIFTPNGFTPSPVIKLFRGQTYTFDINSPGNPFSIKLSRSTGTTDRYNISSIDNYGVETGTITFTVPSTAPTILYYQSEADINLGGVFEIFDIDENTYIDVEADVLGKKNYRLSDGTALSNGMKVNFGGNVTPATYATGQYYVDGVGSAIILIPESILEIVSPYTTSEAIEFDNTPFDVEPFSDATGYASVADYIVISRASRDHNPWSRYNRWFHADVISASAKFNKYVPSLNQLTRAVRPIIEFNANLKLFNFGTHAIADVNLIDTHTTDVFSTIEGAFGYSIDGVALTQGQTILFTADTDPLVRNKIYRVEFVDVVHPNRPNGSLINLVEVAAPQFNQVVLITDGLKNQSLMYWYNGTDWQLAQQKTNTNQPPKFDVVDTNAVSYGDTSVYSGSTFTGTPIFSYKIGTGPNDMILGFPLSYKNVSNIGDIVFNFNLITDSFQYKKTTALVTKNINVGYLLSQDFAGNPVYVNGWQVCNANTIQAAVRIYKKSNQTNNFNVDIYDDINNLEDLVVRVYVNGKRLNPSLWNLITTQAYKQVVLTTPIALTDMLTIRAFASQPINSNGYYEIPSNLQNNPLNNAMVDFTLGEVIDHVNSIVDNLTTFVGSFPGTSNLRDLGNVTQYGVKFVQHSGPMSLSLYHVTSESNNIVRAIEQSRDDYNNFKRIFLNTAENLGIDGDPVMLVDVILQKINKDRPNTAPYYFSDMVPYGASIKTDLSVVDYRIKTYPLSSVFTLDTLSTRAVGVYLNGVQLIYGQDYTFNNQGFVVIDPSLSMSNGDTITTYEYENTNGCFVPATPTKLGMWPKYAPKIYLDTTLVAPQLMIQGHDGSQVLAYGDYRDVLILELEKRIFNNIKVNYDTSIFDITSVIPGYNRTTDYSRSEFDTVLAPNFYRWAKIVGSDFTKPLSYDINNTFTYNYSSNHAPDGSSIPGYWRGVYRWLLDTDRPNICPWEMLGFSIEPSWWTSLYGPAPYTSDNRVMWQDIADGIVRDPSTAPVKLSKYAKPFLMQHIPVDELGNLISPIQSGLAQGLITASTDLNFVFGDVGPVEAAWRRSSHYPFSVIITSMLLTPASTFGLLLDRSRIIRNLAGQLVYSDTGLRIRPQDVMLPSVYSSATQIQTAGIINYVVDLIQNYIFSNNKKSYEGYLTDLMTMNTQLSYRIGAFSNKDQFNLLLDSKTPSSTGSVFIPQENYSIFLNKSSPVLKLSYSGIIITRLQGGFQVSGYSQTQPYFKYYNYLQSGSTVNIGGISDSYSVWTPGEQYTQGSIVKYNGGYFRTLTLTTASATFDPSKFASLNSLPVVGGVNAVFRKLWDKTTAITVPYGTEFSTIQETVDFIVGYGEWLKGQGFSFNEFNGNLGLVTNWETSAKEFMFWTTQNWSTGQDKWSDWTPNNPITYGTIVRYNGTYYSANLNMAPTDVFNVHNYTRLDGLSVDGASVISLSPSADNITFTANLAVVDDIGNQFNSYEIVKVDGTALPPNDLDSYRKNNIVSYNPRTTDGIYGASFYLIQHEHVIIIDNNTIFNDTIYNPESGYRQERIKISGYITTGWYGGLDIPGFIFDQAGIQAWQPWQDYNMGDIVNYQGYYYSANEFLSGAPTFVSTSWTQLATKPTPQILPNWTNIATQFTDFYSLDVDSFDTAQQTMAQHLVGYQKRQYLGNIIQDDVSEFKFYQGMIREKGTQNVLNKLFDVLSSENKESLTFYEEWAVRVGQYGAARAFNQIEFILDEGLVKNNPQAYDLLNKTDSSLNTFIIQLTPTDVYLAPTGYNSQPWPQLNPYRPFLRSAGYVNSSDVSLSIGNTSSIINQDPTQLTNGSYIWCAFEGASWNVYRFTDINLKITAVAYDTPSKILTITTDRLVTLKVGSYIGITQTTHINGFYSISSVTLNSFTVSATVSSFAPFNDINTVTVYALTSQRLTTSIDNLPTILPLRFKQGELLWTDNTLPGDNKWSVWTYSTVYNTTSIANPLPQLDYNYGGTIAMNNLGNIMAFSTSDGQTTIYSRYGTFTNWTGTQILSKPELSVDYTVGDTQGTISKLAVITNSGSLYTPASGTVIYPNVSLTGGTGSGAVATIFVKNGQVVRAQLIKGGINYKASDILSVDPATVGGTGSGFTVSVLSVNINQSNIIANVIAMSDDSQWMATGSPQAGYIATRLVTHSAPYLAGDIVKSGNSYYQTPNALLAQYVGISGTTINQAQGARFTIVVHADNSKTVTIISGGAGYKQGNTIRILGSILGGIDSVDDITFTVNVTGSTIISISNLQGTTPLKTYSGLSGSVELGVNATYNITPTFTGYTVVLNTNGTGYFDQDKILIKGSTIGGSDILNDLTLIIRADGTVLSNSGVSAWHKLSYLPVDATSTSYNSSHPAQGVISLYKKNANNNYTLVDSIVSPTPADNEQFGSSLAFSNNELYVGAIGNTGNTGIIYKLAYSTIIQQSSAYNPVGSGPTANGGYVISVTSTAGIAPDMFIQGTGFTSGQYVFSILSSTTMSISSAPDSPPSGVLNFVTTEWIYDGQLTTPGGITTNSNFGNIIEISLDGSTLVTNSAQHVYVYKKTNSIFNLTQTLTGLDMRFGCSAALSNDGTYLAISDDITASTTINQAGSVGVYSYVNGSYVKCQDVVNSYPEITGRFGNKVFFMNDSSTLVVYSLNGDTQTSTTFDANATTFDKGSTLFVTNQINSGRVDIYDRYATQWVYSESLVTNDTANDGYGTGLAVANNQIFVGAPYAVDQGVVSGKIYNYHKTPNTYSWRIRSNQIVIPDVTKIKKAFLYNRSSGKLVTYLDVIDPLQGKIAGPAEEEIKYKTFYDPAVYSVGTGSVTVDSSTAWTGQQVGMLWWDLRTAKFINSYDQDLVYRNSVWNQLAAGASIDIYEWVTTNLKPSQWDAQADTTAGLTSGISGKSLYGDTVYSTKQTYDKISKSFKNIYYFWVKNKAVTPNILGRNMSAQDVASLIQSPRGQGYTYLALTGINTFSLANVKQYLASNDVVLSVEYWTTANTNQNVHNQYKLISNDPNIDLPKTIEQKWIDSLCGIDSAGRLVPDPSLPIKIRYGVENRPRQGMFVNRLEALKEFIEYVNQTLIKNQIVESYNISNLESYDKEPTIITGLYDAILDVNSELSYTNVISFTVPNLTPIITDGRITGITIVNAGRGYINSINGTATSPYIEIVGSGQGAVVKSIINSLGQITGATIISSGEGYDFNTQCIIRSYSVLIHSDSQAGGNWSIYTYDVNSKLWSRTLTQGYDVRNYWAYTDWYGSYTDPTTGRTLFTATKFTAADFLVTTLVDLNTIKSLVGQTVKVRNVGTGGWLLLYKYADSTSIDWTQSYATVGIQNGTIQFSSSLYDFSNTVIGYDSSIFDGESFDVVAGTELRIILDTIKNNILTNELKQEYLNLFFNSVRYTYSEQPYVDWIFKTSFVKAQHNVGALDQPINYPVDNLANFENYIGEVKPYKTKVREYVSNYESLDTAQLPITDFDLMPVFENGSVRLIDTHVIDGKISANDPNIQKYPWKFWLDNVGFTVTSLVLTSGGAGYITEPVVTIVSSSGSGATARAFISNGRVNRIVLLTQGSNYLSAPTVVIDGGLVHGGTAARAVAIIGDSVIRSTSIGMKFDRTSSTNYISQLQQVETFTGTGSLLTFKLKWAPDVRVGTFSVSVNNIPQLRELYTLSIIKNTSVTTAQLPSYTQYSGLLTFNVDYAPAYGSEIVVTYLIDESLLTATDRIEFYYNPTTGQLGKDLNQLMTGIDYGGVIVDGLGFNIQTGWGSLPYYQDKWDSSYNSTFTDFIVTVKADTHSFTLPYVPANGTELNVYHVKNKVEGPFIADGTTLEYNFNILDNNPVVTTVDTQPAYGIQTTYNIDGSYDNVLVVNSASGIVAGMGIVGIGFASNVAVLTVTGTSGDGTTATLTFDAQSAPPYTIGQQITVNNILPLAYNGTYIVTACTAGNPNVKPSIPGTVSYASTATGSKTQTGTVKGSNPHTVTSVNLQTNTVILNRNPDSIPSGTLTFTFGFAGSTQISIADTNNINIGDLVQCPSLPTSVFVEGTTVVSKGIDGHTLTLDKLVYSGITYSTPITFTRTLEQPTDLIINANGTFVLTRAIPAGLDIYVTGQMNPERLDSPAYGTPSAPATSIMLPLVSDGIPDNPLPAVPAKTFQIPNTFTVNDGDEFILRQSTSDGAVPPTADSYDTEIAGGDLTSNTTYTELAPYTIDGSYYTARGIVADDIIIDGDGMVTPTTSPAPEEVVPGQVVDTVAIKVYDRPTSGSANIKVDNFIGNGVTTEFVMTQQPNSPQAVIVKVGNEIKTIELDYTVDYQNKTINLKLAPTVGQLVSLFNIGFNGANILDLDFFIGDGVTTEFVTKAPWTTPVTSLVYINGQISNPTLFKTDNTYEFANAIGLKFNSPPPLESLINFIIVNGDQQTFSITNSEIIATDGRPATSGYQLIYPVGNSLPNETNMIVRVDQTILDGPNNSYFTISSNRLNYILDATKVPSYSASIQQINVIADGTLLKLGNDYTIDPSGVTIKITKSTYNTYKGTLLVVSVTTGESYFYNTANRSITFTHVYDNTHQVEVISSYNHTILDIQRTEVTISATTTLVPNTVDYYYYRETLEGLIKLDRSVVNDSSVWVIKNSTLLTPNIDYRLNDDRQSIQLSLIPTIGDKISLITFGSNVLTSGIAYMQFKDMLNRVTYKRLSVNKRTKLAQDLHWNDTQIVVTDASNLSIPNPSRNLPGILEIRGERIEYFAKSGNILSRLRRGTLGTGVYNLNKAGTFVQDIGLSETIPYIETATTEQIVSDGTLIVDLGFVPGGFDTTWTYKGQPMTASDATLLAKSAVEVFAGGIRLKKNPYAVHNVNRAPYSPAGDVNFSEEFAVDGVSRQITLTNTVPKNTQITVIKRTGTVWDSTVNIQNDISKITDFLKSAPGIWYTEYTS